MARVNLYIPDKDEPKVKKLKRICDQNRVSLSEWFIRMAIKEIEAAK